MRKSDEATLQYEQVEELRERMRMLQGDRRANVELLETHKKLNVTEINNMREENKELRTRVAHLKRNESTAGADAEIEGLKKDLVKLRKTYDELKGISTKASAKMEALKDEVRACELESRRPTDEDTPLTRSIRVLENRLDKAMIKYNEATSIRKTYEQIVRRLKEERVGFDNQLSALERTLAAKQRDYEELLLLSGDANHAREIAQLELDRVRSGYEEEKVRRESELRERHQLVQMRRQMKERRDKREKERAKIVEDNARVLDEEGEKEMRDRLKGAESEREKFVLAKNKIDIFENAFRKIKDATGVSGANEVIMKVESQEGTMQNLLALQKENQNRIINLQEECASTKERIDSVKFTGVQGGHRRKLVDEQEQQLVTSNTRLHRCQAKFGRLNDTLTGCRAGVEHVTQKIMSVGEDFPFLEMVEGGDGNLVEALRLISMAGENMMNRIRAHRIEEGVLGVDKDKLGEDQVDEGCGSVEGNRAEEEMLRVTRPFNARILLPSGDDWE
eukprot:CAMPEP_0118645206 /NCGR_PEP_ID=MMETSP0785-20121206/7373_1 /TAXON_ID=91992 /ORGANISM="Bolidomonas pacifica, Strain CCMP 1866" /LENGTH=507 /DNA_ID=CAMNT_0006537065 /DNA_START=937 /DNA_END=2457 /DNA_ORIENTATION=-